MARSTSLLMLLMIACSSFSGCLFGSDDDGDIELIVNYPLILTFPIQLLAIHYKPMALIHLMAANRLLLMQPLIPLYLSNLFITDCMK